MHTFGKLVCSNIACLSSYLPRILGLSEIAVPAKNTHSLEYNVGASYQALKSHSVGVRLIVGSDSCFSFYDSSDCEVSDDVFQSHLLLLNTKTVNSSVPVVMSGCTSGGEQSAIINAHLLTKITIVILMFYSNTASNSQLPRKQPDDDTKTLCLFCDVNAFLAYSSSSIKMLTVILHVKDKVQPKTKMVILYSPSCHFKP